MKVLVAYDGSQLSKKALNRAIEISTKLGAELILLTVTEPVCPIGISEEDCARMDKILKKETEDLLNDIKKDLEGKTLKVETYVRKGSAADEIIKLSEKEGVDMIVVGSHGRHGAKKFFLGSVSERVAAHSPCQVLIVK